MATYILLLTLTPEGREKALADPDSLRRAEAAIRVPGTQVLGLYGVLGQYDFVSILDAEDNAAVAQFSLDSPVLSGSGRESRGVRELSAGHPHQPVGACLRRAGRAGRGRSPACSSVAQLNQRAFPKVVG